MAVDRQGEVFGWIGGIGWALITKTAAPHSEESIYIQAYDMRVQTARHPSTTLHIAVSAATLRTTRLIHSLSERPGSQVIVTSSPGERLEVPHDVSEIVDKHISALAGYAVGLALYMLQFKVQSE